MGMGHIMSDRLMVIKARTGAENLGDVVSNQSCGKLLPPVDVGSVGRLVCPSNSLLSSDWIQTGLPDSRGTDVGMSVTFNGALVSAPGSEVSPMMFCFCTLIGRRFRCRMCNRVWLLRWWCGGVTFNRQCDRRIDVQRSRRSKCKCHNYCNDRLRLSDGDNTTPCQDRFICGWYGDISGILCCE
jgi:hypothetical protein